MKREYRQSPSESATLPPHGKSTILLLNGFAVVVVLLHVSAALFPSAVNWGFHHLAFLPTTWKIVIPLLMLIILVPSVQDAFIKGVEKLVRWVQGLPRGVFIALCILALVAATALFWVGRQATFFLGDGMVVMRTLKSIQTTNDIANAFINAPLPGFLIWHLYQLLLLLKVDDAHQVVFQLLSVGVGLATLVTVRFLVRHFAEDLVEQTLAFLFIIAGASVQLFFGYVENYVLAMLAGVLFVLLSIAYLRHRVHIVFPSLAFGLLFVSHFGFFIMLPLLLFIYYHAFRRRHRLDVAAATLDVGLAIVATAAFIIAVLSISGYSVREVMAEFAEQGGKHLVPLTDKSAGSYGYTMFSLMHAVDIANFYGLLSPFGWIVIIGLGPVIMRSVSRDKAQLVVLGMMTIIGFLFTVAFDFDIGMSRDWDLLAVYNVAFLLLPAYCWSSLVHDMTTRRRMMAMMVGITLLHTVPWVLVNAQERTSVARFEILRDRRLWGASAINYANEELGHFFRDRGDVDQAVAYYKEGLAGDSTNSRRWVLLASAYQSIGQQEKAMAAYRKAVELGTRVPEVCDILLQMYVGHQRVDEALEAFRRGLTQDPESPALLYYTGFGLAEYKQEYENATRYLVKALAVNPNAPPVYETLGYCYYNLKKFPEMRTVWERYIQLAPGGPGVARIQSLLDSTSSHAGN